MTAAKPEMMRAIKDIYGDYTKPEGALFEARSQTDADELERLGYAVRVNSDEKK